MTETTGSLDLNSEVAQFAEAGGFEQSLSAAFSEYSFQLLVEIGELGAPIVGASSRRTMQISGVDWDEERRILTCLSSSFATEAEASFLDQRESDALFDRLLQFVIAACDGLAAELLPSDSSRDVALTIQEAVSVAESVRFVLITNQDYDGDVPSLGRIKGLEVQAAVWDGRALQQALAGTGAQVRLDVDLTGFGIDGVEAIGPFGVDTEYGAYLVVFTGDCLADIYARYGPRLLELNVRSFLQARNKVNRGIQTTLSTEPEKFLAYNNGLSLTASKVERALVKGQMMITSISDLQIVNGGQTTASLYHAKYRSKSDLAAVRVQAKITVLGENARIELAPKISLYANSQNPIRMADFSANDPFHVKLQRLSRDSVPPSGSGEAGSKWFYERARGQYADLVSTAQTPARVAAVRREYPLRQKLLKTDIAKYELLWDQRPNLVALGGERYFAQFMQLLRERPTQSLPDVVYFEHLIAKAILWRSADAIVGKLALGGYKAQTVAYTMALISKRTAQRVDLDSIWASQSAPLTWVESVTELGPLVQSRLLATAGTRNVSEWAKKEDCWDAIQQIEWDPPVGLISTRAQRVGRSVTAPSGTSTSLPASDAELDARVRTIEFGSANWFELSAWAKDTGNLAPWQRSIAFSLGRLVSQGKEPSEKQSLQGAKILDESSRLGFVPTGPMFSLGESES